MTCTHKEPWLVRFDAINDCIHIIQTHKVIHGDQNGAYCAPSSDAPELVAALQRLAVLSDGKLECGCTGKCRAEDIITTAEEARLLDDACREQQERIDKEVAKAGDAATAMPSWDELEKQIEKAKPADNFYRPEKRVSQAVGKQLNWWIVGALAFGLCFWYGVFKFVPFVYHLLCGR